MSTKSFVMGSRHRRNVLAALEGKPKTASDLSEELDVRIQTASRALREHAEKSLVQCVNPQKRKGRVYELTKRGRKMIRSLPYEKKRLERKVLDILEKFNVEFTRNKEYKGGSPPGRN